MIRLAQGDCLEIMRSIPDGSVDLVLTNPPYGVTACKWNAVVSLDLMWVQLKRITKVNGVVVILGGVTNHLNANKIPINLTYPNELLIFRECSGDRGKSSCPTEKPVDLISHLIKTHTTKGEIILDFTMGGGTIGVAAKRLGRSFLGIELDEGYFKIARDRIETTTRQMKRR